MVWIAANPFVMNLIRSCATTTLSVPITTSVTTSTTTTSSTTTITTAITTTTTTTATTTTATTTKSFLNYTSITRPNDNIVGIFNTTAGSFNGATIGSYPTCEPPTNAIDMNVGSKYLNHGTSGSSTTAGLNTGYYVSPRVGNSIATGIIFSTANDSPNRDPTMITLEGSNDGFVQLQLGGSWTLIYSGPSGISSTVDPGRSTKCTLIAFNNTIPYVSYRLLITSKRGADNSVQYSEAHIMGYV